MADRKTLEDCCKEDFEYFKKCIQRGVSKLVGSETNERVNYCFHCKIWSRANKFIKDIEKLGDIIPKQNPIHESKDDNNVKEVSEWKIQRKKT